MFHQPSQHRRSRALATSLAILLLAAAGSASAEPRTFRIDPAHFSIGFLVEHVGYADTLGMFETARGEFVYDEENRELHSGRVEITASSVYTNHAERDEHLRGEDFLHVDEHPDIVFEATGFEADEGANTGELTGRLTMLGQTRPVTLDVTLNKAAEYPFGHGEYTLGVSARATIRRSEWGMTYAVENGLVGDRVDLILEFEAIRQ
ncbi:YceI family protein [Ectothiorhodospiraceae bacterium WFHF3C12]|nr:YceI family protein [Ectothiorhodospiraceae bacterium WFHF3C12]